MSRTDFAKEILAIAQRVLDEKAVGRSVDPMRVEWAETTLRANAPHHQTRARVPTTKPAGWKA